MRIIGAEWRIKREMAKLGVEKYFDFIVSAQEIRAIKPSPVGLNLIIKKFGARRDKVLYTGDMTDDVVMAKYAKVHSCAIADGFSSYGQLKDANPDYLLKNMLEFKKAL